MIKGDAPFLVPLAAPGKTPVSVDAQRRLVALNPANSLPQYAIVPARDECTVTVAFGFTPATQFDQAGLMVLLVLALPLRTYGAAWTGKKLNLSRVRIALKRPFAQPQP